jgi:ribosomal protein S17E
MLKIIIKKTNRYLDKELIFRLAGYITNILLTGNFWLNIMGLGS